MPPRLRWFMRTTFMPAANAFWATPLMYRESLDPSSPWTTITVSAQARSSSCCQRHQQRTLIAGATSINRSSAVGKWILRGSKKLAIVCTCPPRSHRRGWGGGHQTISIASPGRDTDGSSNAEYERDRSNQPDQE